MDSEQEELHQVYLLAEKTSNLITIDSVCAECQNNYRQKWIPKVTACDQCERIRFLEQRNTELEEVVEQLKQRLELEQEMVEKALEKSAKWHERDLEAKVAARIQENTTLRGGCETGE